MGVFWHNAAETWIDITNAAANKVGVCYGWNEVSLKFILFWGKT